MDNISFWQFLLYWLLGAMILWTTLYVGSHAVCKAYFEHKKQFIADITNAGAKALTKYKEEVKKNDQA